MNRRKAIKLGLSTATLAATGLYGGYRLVPPGPSRALESVDTLAGRFYASLNDDQRAETCVAYDHPMRQYHNRGVSGGGAFVLASFNRKQRQLLTDLMYAGLSESGRGRIPEEYFTRWSGVHSMRVLVCGDPTAGPYQIIMTGVHVNLRVGGKSREGAAFGGPQVYGDQRGNERAGLPGNIYREQFLLAHQIFKNLDDGRRKLALVDEAPVQTQIELQGPHGSFQGIPAAELDAENKNRLSQLTDLILSTYREPDVAFARECLEANGGLDALRISYYQHGEDGDIPEGQVFRLEGPASVFYFRGYPHVHAFINVAMDGESPLSVGEPLGSNPTWLEGAAVKRLFETALRQQTGADLAFYDKNSVAGRLRPGVVRAGDIYTLESWQESAQVVEIRGAHLSPTLVSQLRDQQKAADVSKTYTVATTNYVATEDTDKVGRVGRRRSVGLLRDLTVAYLKTHGFTPPAT
jgi:hypothetical protein